MSGPGHIPGPYAITFLFICGVFLANIPMNLFFMKKPTHRRYRSLDVRILPRQAVLAPLRNLRRLHLGHRRNRQLRLLARPLGRLGGFVLARPGRNHDFNHLGRLHLEGVRRSARPWPSATLPPCSSCSSSASALSPPAPSSSPLEEPQMVPQKTVLVVGSINTDLVVKAANLPARGQTITGDSFHTYQGGKGANQAGRRRTPRARRSR